MYLRTFGKIVGILLLAAGSCQAQIFYPDDNGFESPNEGTGFAYQPTGTDWTFSAGAGIAANDSTFDVENATRGQASDSAVSSVGQAGFVQGTSSISQRIYLTAGYYQIKFDAEGRGGPFFPFDANELTVALNPVVAGVTVPATPIFDGTPPQDGYFHSESSTTTPLLAAGYYILTFSGISVGTGDYTSFIDNVQVDTQTAPEPGQVALMLLGGLGLWFGRRFLPLASQLR